MINEPFVYSWYLSLDAYKEYKLKAVLWTVKNWYLNLCYLFKWVKWFFQRGSRGWADCDWWNMNYYLTQVIPPMLKKIKEQGHGYPGRGEASTPEKWDALLDEMIEAFEAADRILEDDYYTIVSPDFPEKPATHEDIEQWMAMSEADQKIFKKKIKIFVKWLLDLWD